MCEAVRGDVWDGGFEDGRLGGIEGTGWRRMVVGMVGPDERKRAGF